MNTQDIHNLQRECREQDLLHKRKQVEYETKYNKHRYTYNHTANVN